MKTCIKAIFTLQKIFAEKLFSRILNYTHHVDFMIEDESYIAFRIYIHVEAKLHIHVLDS